MSEKASLFCLKSSMLSFISNESVKKCWFILARFKKVIENTGDYNRV